MYLKDKNLNGIREDHNRIENFREFIYENVDEIYYDDSITAITGILLEKLDELQDIYYNEIKTKEQELLIENDREMIKHIKKNRTA
jgi:lipopolysaccharide export LptBFGC system permease protein LptF